MNHPPAATTHLADLHQGRAIWHLNALLVFKVLSVETGGLFWMLEGFADQRFEMFAHLHRQEDEALYVLDGEMISRVGHEMRVNTPGAFLYIPHGVQHTFRVKSATARWLNIGLSGNFDQWFFETGEPAPMLTLPPVSEVAIRDLTANLEVYGASRTNGLSGSLHPSFFTAKGENIMSAVAVALPILSGKTDEWKRVVAEATGKRRAELDDMHKRLRVRAARWFLQPTPNGDVGIVYLEGDGADTAFAGWGQSQHPFDLWFKESIGATYGVDFNGPPPGPAPQMMYEFLG